MIKEAINRILELATGTIIKDDFGRQVWDKSGAFLNDPAWPQLKVLTLTALVDYIKDAHPQAVKDKDFIHIIDPVTVSFRGQVEGEKKSVDRYITAECLGEAFSFGRWIEVETFVIQLQTFFIQDKTTAKLLEIVGNLSSDTSVKTLDDGVSQQVTAKTGITMVGNVQLPNPVELKPYRTFREVDQPTSKYVFRMRKERDAAIACALFDVGGNLWEGVAIAAIKQWLEDELASTITTANIPILG